MHGTISRNPGQACLLRIFFCLSVQHLFDVGQGLLESESAKEHETTNSLSVTACFRREMTEDRAGDNQRALVSEAF